jgi:RNA polymerase sigma-70 factor (ECF subfamily)
MHSTTETPLPVEDEAHQQWVSSMVGGCQDGLAALFDRFGQRVYGVAERILRNDADAQEVVSEVFSQVWRDANRFDPSRGTVSAWIGRLSHSRAIDRLRRRKARPDSHVAMHLDQLDTTYPQSTASTPDLLDDLQNDVMVREAFRAMGTEQKRCVALAFLEGLSHQEISERLTMPLGTVKSHVRRGLLAMRGFLESRGIEGTDS